MEYWELILIGLAAVAAGFVNALAGGGTLITFPVLTAFGIPAVSANITNTIALCPGYFGGTWAQRNDLKGQRSRLLVLVPVAVAGGLGGGLLLLLTGEKLFRDLVPWLILFATLLLALQPLIRRWVMKDGFIAKPGIRGYLLSIIMVLPSTVYGGYFGAGLGVVLLAVLGITQKDHIVRLNALKQALSLATNVAAATFFLFSDLVNWPLALIMAACALSGGYFGGKFAGKMKPEILRGVIVAAGLAVFVLMLIKL